MKLFESFGLFEKVILLGTNGWGWSENLVEALLDSGALSVIVANATADYEGLSNQRVVKLKLDFACAESVDEMLRAVLKNFDRLDVLINAFDMVLCKPFLRITEAEWDKVMRTNLKAVFLLTRVAGRIMTRQGFGSIVNIVSVSGSLGVRNAAAYAAALGAVNQLTRSLALEWASSNVRVNSVAMGFPDGAMKEERDGMLKRYIPLSRFPKFEDLAPLVIFLSSSASSYMTGHVYHVDGGLLARG